MNVQKPYSFLEGAKRHQIAINIAQVNSRGERLQRHLMEDAAAAGIWEEIRDRVVVDDGRVFIQMPRHWRIEVTPTMNESFIYRVSVKKWWYCRPHTSCHRIVIGALVAADKDLQKILAKFKRDGTDKKEQRKIARLRDMLVFAFSKD